MVGRKNGFWLTLRHLIHLERKHECCDLDIQGREENGSPHRQLPGRADSPDGGDIRLPNPG